MSNIYVNGGNGTSTGYWGVTVWSSGLSVSTSANGGRGTYVRQTAPSATNERVFRLTVACTGGVTGATEPSWNTGKNGTTSDHGGTWTECTGQEADMGTGGTWLAPHATIYNALQWFSGSSDVIYVNSSHQCAGKTGNVTPGANGAKRVICVTGSNVPPVSGDVTTGAFETYSTTVAYENCMGYWEGIRFKVSNVVVFRSGNQRDPHLFHNCRFSMDVDSNYILQLYDTISTVTPSWLLQDCTVDLISSQSSPMFELSNNVRIKNLTINGGGSVSSTFNAFFFGGNAINHYLDLIVEDTDLSVFTGANNRLIQFSTSQGRVEFRRCKFNSANKANWIYPNGNDFVDTPGAAISLLQCDSGTGTVLNEVRRVQGHLSTATDVYRTGGASDGTTPYSRKIDTTANDWWYCPFEALPVAKWNTTTGSSVSVTWYGVYNGAALPTNQDVWGEVEYFSDASSVLGSTATGTTANILTTASNLAADTSAWDAGASARQNSHTYAVGDAIKVASNPGRIFFCTASSGNTAGSEPGGYASAVDGGSVTDGSATFRAGVRFSQTITMTPQHAGYLQLTIRIAKPSATYFIDPSF